jgi:drug/metabolite transporter (DMT)-like permease
LKLKILGGVLLVAGVLMLVFRGFSYTKERHEARIGGFGIGLEERERVEIPVWAGAIVTLAGGALLATGSRASRRKD